LLREFENVVEALCKCGITRLVRTKMVCGVKAMKDVAERIRSITELNENRGEQSASILFFLIPEVEKEVGNVR